MAVQATSEEKQKRKKAFGFQLTKKQLEAGKKFFESLSQKRVEQTKKRIAAPPKAKEKARKAKPAQSATTQKRAATETDTQKIETAAKIAELGPQILKAQAETELAESKADQGHLATEIAAQKTETATKIADTARVKLGQAEEEAAQVAKQGGFESSIEPGSFANDPIVGTPEESLQRLGGNIEDFAQFPEFGRQVDPSGLQPTEFADALARRTEVLSADFQAPGSAFTRRPGEQDFINVLAKLKADRELGQAGSLAASQRARFEKSLTGGVPLTGAQLARIDREAVSQINLRAKGGFLGLGRQKQRERALLNLHISGRGINVIAASDSQRQKLAQALKNNLNLLSPEDQRTQGLGRTDALNRLAAVDAGIANEAMTGFLEDNTFSEVSFISAHYQGILGAEDDALGRIEIDDPFGDREKAQIVETANRAKQDAIDSIAAAMVEQNELTEEKAKAKGVEISAVVGDVFLNKDTGILRDMKDSVGKNARSGLFLVGAVRMQQDVLEYSRKLQEALIKFAKLRIVRKKEEAKISVQRSTLLFVPGTRTAEEFFRRASKFQQSLERK